MNEINERLKQIDTEYDIWLIYFIIIGLSIYGNTLEKKYFLYNDEDAKDKYRMINTIVFIIAICVYAYFFADGYKAFQNLKQTDSEKKRAFTELNLIATTLILISGIIFLYIIINDSNLETEVAFT